MTERLNCGNCGGPLTRAGSESSITCPHCEHATEVGSPGGRDDDDDDDDSSSSNRDRGHVPAIIVINAGGGGNSGPSFPSPQPVVTRTVVVSRGSSFSFITPIIFIAIAVSASLAIRHHIMKSIPSIPSPAAAAAGNEPPKHEEPKHEEHGKHGH
jgi:hypothetical protein